MNRLALELAVCSVRFMVSIQVWSNYFLCLFINVLMSLRITYLINILDFRNTIRSETCKRTKVASFPCWGMAFVLICRSNCLWFWTLKCTLQASIYGLIIKNKSVYLFSSSHVHLPYISYDIVFSFSFVTLSAQLPPLLMFSAASAAFGGMQGPLFFLKVSWCCCILCIKHYSIQKPFRDVHH